MALSLVFSVSPFIRLNMFIKKIKKSIKITNRHNNIDFDAKKE
jgi:hypothetical protein